MRRRALTPHTGCGLMRSSCVPSRHRERLFVSAAAGLAKSALVAGFVGFFGATVALAQDPSIRTTPLNNDKTFSHSASTIVGPAPKINSALPLNLQADQLVYDTRGSKIIARGNVEVFYNNFVLTADEIIYDQAANLLTASGNAQLRDPNGNITRAERLEATDDFRDAFVQSLSIVTKDETRIAARRATRRDGNTSEYEQAKFTPCKNDPGKPPLWCISAARIIHDQRAATITYQDAQFELFGVPVLYLPYFEHADPSVKRKSGFLAPHIGQSTSLGFRFEVPYYFALAPTYDFTFSPEYLSKQGMMWKGEFRQRLANGQYTVKGAVIDQDADTLPNSSDPSVQKLNGWRGTIETRGTFSLSSWWKTGWDVTLESDKSFRRFYGFDSVFQTDRVNTAYLTGMSERNYFNAQLYHFGGLLLDDTVTASSRVHPVIDYNYIFNGSVLGGEMSFSGHARSMSRRNVDLNGLVSAGADTTHAVADLGWRRRIIDGLGQTWTPFANLRGDVYSFDNTRDPVTGLNLESDTLLRGVGTAGLTYAYPFVAHTATASHIVEPTVQIVSRNSNKVDQRLLPNEDSKSIVYDDTLLFDVSKTSGYDLIDTGTRANIGVQYTFQANNGFHAKAVFGQSIFLGGNNVFADPGKDVTSTAAAGTFPNSFDPNNGLGSTRSDYVAGVYISPKSNLSLVAQGRFDESDWTLRRQDTLLTFGLGPLTTQAVYTFKAADPALSLTKNQQETQLSLGLRLTDNWSLIGSMRYDIDAHQRIQDAIGLRYADECFVLTTTYSETFVENVDQGIKPDRTVMVRFELKHLGEFNYKTDVTSFLARGDNQPASSP